MDFFKHETACVDEGAQVGSGTRIWHWVHICGGAVLGRNCILGQNVYVGNKVVIGNNVKLQNNVSVYEGVSIEDDVFCGPSMVFTNVMNPRAFIERKSAFKNTLIKKGASLGANCTIICGVTVGEYALVGAGAVISKNVPAYALVTGVPGIQRGWVTRLGNHLPLPLTGSAEYQCPITGDIYHLRENLIYLQS